MGDMWNESNSEPGPDEQRSDPGTLLRDLPQIDKLTGTATLPARLPAPVRVWFSTTIVIRAAPIEGKGPAGEITHYVYPARDGHGARVWLVETRYWTEGNPWVQIHQEVQGDAEGRQLIRQLGGRIPDDLP